MNNPLSKRLKPADHLSVIHKSMMINEPLLLQDAVLQTDLSFNITGWNPVAELLHGQPGALNKYLFDLVKVEFINSGLEQMKTSLRESSYWSGEVNFHRFDGQEFQFGCTASYIINENEQPVSILFVCHNLTEEKDREVQLAEAEKKYETLLNTLPDGVVMLNADGRVAACNKKGAELLGLDEHDYLGQQVASKVWQAIKEDGSDFPETEFPAVVSLQTGFPQRNVKMGVRKPNGMLVWLSVNSQALIRPGEFEPYACVVSYSDITEATQTGKELQRSNERFFHAGRITSDAIWDLDLNTNEIYRSEAFYALSGFKHEAVQSNLNWYFENIHPEDRDRVRQNITDAIKDRMTFWQDEYRFRCADGSYKYLLDKGVFLYRQGKPSRVIGAIQDLTERKRLEARLLYEEIQKQKQVNQASIAAQERERNNISKELHDNVNQILMSAKLFMDTAIRQPEQATELLEKAMEYQVLALHEIRKLSKSLSNSLVETVGLEESIQDIVYNMQKLRLVEVDFQFSASIEEDLSNDQKLMLFRIIQEGTTNIIKYAEANNVSIILERQKQEIYLLIKDDGKGFDMTQLERKGIGLLNMTSRADAFSGTLDIRSEPGKGCTLELRFPVQV